jgi:hypothetical protein
MNDKFIDQWYGKDLSEKASTDFTDCVGCSFCTPASIDHRYPDLQSELPNNIIFKIINLKTMMAILMILLGLLGFWLLYRLVNVFDKI